MILTVQKTASTMEMKLASGRSEEHTSELQSPCNLVCRLLLEKKKKLHPDCRNHRWRSTQHDCPVRLDSGRRINDRYTGLERQRILARSARTCHRGGDHDHFAD